MNNNKKRIIVIGKNNQYIKLGTIECIMSLNLLYVLCEITKKNIGRIRRLVMSRLYVFLTGFLTRHYLEWKPSSNKRSVPGSHARWNDDLRKVATACCTRLGVN